MIVYTPSKEIFRIFSKGRLLLCPVYRFVSLRNASKTIPTTKVMSTGANYSTKEQQSGQKSCASHQSYFYGPPHPISNMPIVKFAKRENETLKEKRFRQFKEELEAWHHQFWLSNNQNFNKADAQQPTKYFIKKPAYTAPPVRKLDDRWSKKAYLQNRNPVKIIDEKERADDLSIFYKDFLDKNYKVHLRYQREWYKKLVKLLWYELQVEFENMMRRFKFRIKGSKGLDKH